jgi:hypothetical protein
VDGQQLGRIRSWSFSSSVEALEVTSLADVARDYTAGLKSSNGSCSVFYYDNAPVPLLSKVVKTGAATDADMVTMTLGWGDRAVTFKALLTSGEISCQVGEVMQANLSFNVCGDLAEVNL